MKWHDSAQFIRIKAVNGLEPLVALNFRGDDYLSRPFQFTLEVASDKTSKIPEWLGRSIAWEVGYQQFIQRFHGIITCISIAEDSGRALLSVEPWLAQLKQNRHYRIFREQSVVDIVTDIFKENDFCDFDMSQLTLGHEIQISLMQYDETDFHFVSRLLEEAGIFYYFEYSQQRHVLHLVDANLQCPLMKQSQHLHALKIMNSLGTVQQVQASSASAIQAGRRILLPHEVNQNFLVTHCHYDVKNNIQTAQSDPEEAHYQADFKAIAAQENFRAPLRHKKPVIRSVLYATVVGVEKQPVNLDESGRIQVSFPWENCQKQGLSPKVMPKKAVLNFTTSWLRVAHAEAGPSWGNFFVPHVGEQVAVSFLQGDIDHPVVLSSIAKNLLLTQQQAGIKTVSGHQLVFDDTPSEMSVRFKSQQHYFESLDNVEQKVKGRSNKKVLKGGQDTLIERGSAKLKAQQSLLLKAGKSRLELNANGIKIHAPKIEINPGKSGSVQQINDESKLHEIEDPMGVLGFLLS